MTDFFFVHRISKRYAISHNRELIVGGLLVLSWLAQTGDPGCESPLGAVFS